LAKREFLYTEDYFERGIESGLSLYENFRWLPDLTIPMVKVIIERLNILLDDSKILDFGCAKGFIVKAFMELGFRNVWGVDISQYAVDNADPDVKLKIILNENFKKINLDAKYFDFIISKDTLEHLTKNELDFYLKELGRLTKPHGKHLHVIPIGDGKRYNCPDYEKDATHIIKEDIDWWMRKFQDHNYKIRLATYRMEGIKDNWYEPCPEGNGFFILEKF